MKKTDKGRSSSNVIYKKKEEGLVIITATSLSSLFKYQLI